MCTVHLLLDTMMPDSPPKQARGSETLITAGKDVVLAVRHADEREAITSLLEEMEMAVHHASDGREAIILLEDNAADFLLMDVQLDDMHAWKMLATLRESVDLASLPTVVIMDDQTVVPLANVTPVVRPVSMAKLKRIIFNLFTVP